MRSLRACALSLLLCAGCGGASGVSDAKTVAVTEVSLDAEGAAGPRAPAESDPDQADVEALEEARAVGVLGVLTDDEQGFAAILGSASVAESIGGLEGTNVGEAFGAGGLGLTGVGAGGGGTAQILGIGRLGTGGGAVGTGSGFSGHGPGRAPLGPVPQIKVGVPTVQGALDPQIVQRILRRHASALRYCYAKEQASAPQLAGVVDVAFTIAPDGSVPAARVAGSTLQNTQVESCVLARIRVLAFPAPERGVVLVAVNLTHDAPPPSAPAAPSPTPPAGGASP